MKEHSRSDRKKLAILGALGLGLAMASKRRRGQRSAFSQMHAAGGPGGAGGFGGHGPWRRDRQAGGGQLPPMIDAKLRAWHEQEHARKATGSTPVGDQPQQV